MKSQNNIKQKIKNYHFQWKHLLVLFIVLIFFQIIISFIQQISLGELQEQTFDWYKRDSAEKIADLTATSFELLLETSSVMNRDDVFRQDMIQAFNIIFSQQLLQENIEDVFVLINKEDETFAIKDGIQLFDYFFEEGILSVKQITFGLDAIEIFKNRSNEIIQNEQIYTEEGSGNIFHVFVPLVPNGEYAGTVYLKISPDFSFINRQVTSSYDQSALIFSALILFGLLAMFYISSYTVKERDETQKQLFKEREAHLREQIDHKKEMLFTKRIYHTHHKAEKVMGFIKEDIKNLDKSNLSILKNRVNKYANFVSRAIYDMKWYDPPLLTIRGAMYNTDINELLEFIVENLFNRISENNSILNFKLSLDPAFPKVKVNEYVVWEIIEPIIQNSVDHSGNKNIKIEILTQFDASKSKGTLLIKDNGRGIKDSLLEETDEGIKKIFMENISTKENSGNSGYGCYLSYEIARKCGWKIDAQNNPDVGSKFSIIMEDLN